MEEEERAHVLERAEKVALTVENKVPEMEVECWELDRGLLLHSSEHLTITGRFTCRKSFQLPICLLDPEGASFI